MKTLATLIAAAAVVLTAGPATAISMSQSKKFDADIIKYTNVERSQHHMAKLKSESCLDKYAQAQAKRQAQQARMFHQDLSKVLRACKVSLVGENVAYGYESGRLNVTAWMNSPPHRENILNSKFRMIGVGVATAANGQVYTAQVFGR